MKTSLANWSTVITAVIAICALVSPILTTLINNSYSLKKSEQELKYKSEQSRIAETSQKYNQQVDIISDFVYSINSAAITLKEEDRKDVARTGAKLLVLLKPADPKIVIDAIRTFNNSSSGWSNGEEIDHVRKLADSITKKAPSWLKQASKQLRK